MGEKLSIGELNRVLLEKIPLEERLKAVYLPIITMDCACYLAEDLLSLLKATQIHNTKGVSRMIRNGIDNYRRDNYNVMRSDLYLDLSKRTNEFYSSLSYDMMIYQIQYQQAILDIGLDFTMDVKRIISMAYVVRELTNFVLELDRNFTKRFSDLLGKGIKYTTEDNQYCIEIVKSINTLFTIVGVPNNLRTDKTDMMLTIFKNKINSIQI